MPVHTIDLFQFNKYSNVQWKTEIVVWVIRQQPHNDNIQHHYTHTQIEIPYVNHLIITHNNILHVTLSKKSKQVRVFIRSTIKQKVTIRRGFYRLSSTVLSCRLNALNCISSRRSAGKLLHPRGPATEKLLSPKVLWVRGRKHVLSVAERRFWRPRSTAR